MASILIIADDLSGAADCASAYAKAGRQTLVVIDRDAAGDTGGADVVALDADSRRMPASQAARLHSDLYARYAAPGQVLYKKIDSTLRGNFAAEIAAHRRRRRPGHRRAGLPAGRPRYPRRPAVSERRAAGGQRGVARRRHCRRRAYPDDARTARHTRRHAGRCRRTLGPTALAGALQSAAQEGLQALVCDVETDDDLQAIARASLQVTVPSFWVGSAGLAAHLAQAAGDGASPPAGIQ